jgi:predicted nucleic acid-binding protein
MAYLLDTSILCRLANKSDIHHVATIAAVEALHRQNEQVYLAPQNLIEFWNVASRPAEVNGLGLPLERVSELIREYETRFRLAQEPAHVYSTLMSLLRQVEVVGKQIHDARIVAVCHVNSITHLLTFNTRHLCDSLRSRPA